MGQTGENAVFPAPPSSDEAMLGDDEFDNFVCKVIEFGGRLLKGELHELMRHARSDLTYATRYAALRGTSVLTPGAALAP